MSINWKGSCRLALIAFGLTLSSQGMAQPSSVSFKISFGGQVDCMQPIQMNNIPIRFDGSGTLNADGTGTADLTETAFVLSTTIHFDGRLGAKPKPGPGGSTQARVAGPHGLLLTWNLPNNQFLLRISVAGRSCSASLDSRLKPGRAQYTLFDGSIYHYCGRPHLALLSCQVQ